MPCFLAKGGAKGGATTIYEREKVSEKGRFEPKIIGSRDRIRTYVGFPRRSYRPTQKKDSPYKTMG